MKYSASLQSALLIRRYKRFLADIRLADNSEITIHCPNTGSMRHCAESGARVWYSQSPNPDRKYPHTWEQVESKHGGIAGINTIMANKLVKEAIENGTLKELQGYEKVLSEVKYGAENSRIDFVLQADRASAPDCYLEVKSVTLAEPGGRGLFPDARTERGHKHLRELMQVQSTGKRAVLLFCVQHSSIDTVEPADAIDEEYGRLLRQAASQGVEILAYKARLNAEEIILERALPVILTHQ